MIFHEKALRYLRLENGSLQGVISPTLFTVLMNVLANIPYPDGTQHTGYTGDTVMPLRASTNYKVSGTSRGSRKCFPGLSILVVGVVPLSPSERGRRVGSPAQDEWRNCL